MRTGPMNTLPAPAPMQMLTYPQQGLPTAGYPSNGYETAGYLPAPANHDPAGEVQNYPMPAKPTMNPRISQLRSETEGNVISNNNMSTSPKARENALQALDEIDKIE
jgi:hypothetical protein